MMLRSKLSFFAFTFVLICLINGEEINTSDSKLKLLHVVFRHGDRSPITLYPNDPNPASSWKQGLGELSLLGKKQHYALGKFLKEKYKGFLTGNPREVLARSSGKDRCLESAESHLASLYAPSPNWTWNPSMNWQPIPIQTVPLESDGMLNPSSKCTAADEETRRLENLPESRDFLEQNKELFEMVSRESGAKIQKWNELSYVYDTLSIEKQYGLVVPQWATPIWRNMSHVHNMTFYLNYQTREIQKLRAGVLLADIAGHMRNLTRNATAELPRLYLYSTHDTQVAVLLNALGILVDYAPSYCSTVAIELWHSNSTGKWAVKVWQLDTPTPEAEHQTPRLLTLPHCNGPVCPLDTFLSILQPLEIRDWEKTCGLNGYSFPRPAILVISLLAVALLLVVSFCAFLLCRRSSLAPPPYHSLNAS